MLFSVDLCSERKLLPNSSEKYSVWCRNNTFLLIVEESSWGYIKEFRWGWNYIILGTVLWLFGMFLCSFQISAFECFASREIHPSVSFHSSDGIFSLTNEEAGVRLSCRRAHVSRDVHKIHETSISRTKRLRYKGRKEGREGGRKREGRERECTIWKVWRVSTRII